MTMPIASQASPVRRFFGHGLPVISYSLVGVALLVQGIRYLGATSYMTYHADVIATAWDNLEENHQTLILGLLKGFGAGSFCVGLAVILMTVMPFRRGRHWPRWAIPTIAATYTAALVYVTKFALLPGATPFIVSLTLFGCVVVAAASSFIGFPDSS